MSEFQLSLLVIGAAVVVAVFAYNKWQEARARRFAKHAFESNHIDVLTEAAEIYRKPARPEGAPSRIEPPEQGMSQVPVSENTQCPYATPIDYTMELVGESNFAGSIFQEYWQSAEHRFAARLRFLGGEGAALAPVEAGGKYRRLEASLQLVSRSGVVSESELLEFRSAVESLAARLGISVQSPEMREALERARKLDEICAESDIEVAFHVVAADGQSIDPVRVHELTISAGMSPRIEGGYSFRDSGGREIFVLSEGEMPASGQSTRRPCLTISMDVPRAPDTQMSFELMVNFARQLASDLGGSLVDDNNRTIDEKSLQSIVQQLTKVRATLETAGVVPGSDMALRLFS